MKKVLKLKKGILQNSCLSLLSLLLSNQNEILKRAMTWTEQKPKGTTFKVHSIAIANPLYIDLIHQCTMVTFATTVTSVTTFTTVMTVTTVTTSLL